MAEPLKVLPEVARLSDRVIRILGSNPGKFTLQGTNTYLVTRPPVPSSTSPLPSILIDTGEGVESYVHTLERVLTGKDPVVGPRQHVVTDIILTHRHHDHVGGLPSVLALLARLRSEASPGAGEAGTSTSTSPQPPRLHKFPDPATDPTLLRTLSQLPPGSFRAGGQEAGSVKAEGLLRLRDGDLVQVPSTLTEEANVDAAASSTSSEAPTTTTTLRVVHTPGHTSDHICLLLQQEAALFTGDHVLGQGTSVFEDLGSYMASLRKCSLLLSQVGGGSGRPNDGAGDENVLYPAHGPVLERGRAKVEAYYEHRKQRERQVLELLAQPPPAPSGAAAAETGPEADHPSASSSSSAAQEGAGWKIGPMVAQMYSSYPEHLWPAAAHGLFLLLRKLSLPDLEEAVDAAAGGGGGGGGGGATSASSRQASEKVACYDAEGRRVHLRRSPTASDTSEGGAGRIWEGSGATEPAAPGEEPGVAEAMEWTWRLLPGANAAGDGGGSGRGVEVPRKL